MDDDLLHLEAELKRLRPASPSRELVARLQDELSRPAPRYWRGARLFWLAALPAAAALALMQTLWRSKAPAASIASERSASSEPAAATVPMNESALRPVAAENVLVSASDEGLVTLEDGTTARRTRLRYVDTITWRNPQTNASLRWSVPREEVRVVPVVFQ